MKTEITNLLGVSYPILQGGMAWVAEHKLASAVSEAGGFGIIGAGGAPAAWVEEQIWLARKRTDKPFGVNLMLMNPEAEQIAEVIAKERVSAVTTGAGSPEKYMERWKSMGVKVIPVVASVALAKRMERAGADAVVAEGTESGGHIGELTTMALVPQVCDAVQIPVIAAGGIADGRGIAAALMLGAKAVQMGTRFITTVESTVHKNYKERVLRAKDIDSKVTGRGTGHPVRCLRNQMTNRYLRREAEGASFEELEQLTLGGLRRAVVEGDMEGGSIMAGQIAGLVHEELTCRELLEKLMRETREALRSGSAWFAEEAE
ncbi:MAG: enoyl-[acyl-carrier-protein] reductase FabK [Lachnospiraceae bacterium]|nr:enoyl-[acyl-carrier-protein] reductase FabK [Lachnospiraceae bacterium]